MANKGNTDQDFRALVEYQKVPHEELGRRFESLSDEYKQIEFDPIDSCRSIARETREIRFRVETMDVGNPCCDEVLDELEKRGLRPAVYEELLAFAAKFPEEQREYPITALGSIGRVSSDSAFGSGLCSPFLTTRKGLRRLALGMTDVLLPGDVRFLAVEKTV